MGNRHPSSPADTAAPVCKAWLSSSCSSTSLSECSSAGDTTPSDHDAFGQDVQLTQAEIRLVRRSWRQSRCNQATWEPGLTIFKRLFAESPEIRNVFSWGDSELMAPGENVYRQRLQLHCDIFSSAIDKLVANLDHDHVITNELTMLGRRHAHMAPRGFKPEFWDQFGRAIIHSAIEWESKNHSHETKEAWGKVVHYMLDKMRMGYYAELRRLDKAKSKRKRTSSKPRNSEASQTSLTITCMIGAAQP